MKNFLYAAAFMLILGLVSCSKKISVTNSNMTKPSIQANIQGLGNDTILVLYHKILNPADFDESVKDTIVAQNGRFTYDLAIEEPVLLYLMPQKAIITRADGRPFWAKEKSIVVLVGYGDKIEITGELYEYYTDYEVKGSEFNEYYTQVRKSYITAAAEAVKLELELDAQMAGKANGDVINVLFQKRNDINKISRLAQLEFIKNNPEKELSAYYLTLQPLDTIEKYYSALAPDVREGMFQRMLDDKLNTLKKLRRTEAAELAVKEGEVAPDFKLGGLYGEFSLNAVKSKYIVLDFWASWCAPCIKGLARMKEYYWQYQNQAEFIGINCNESEEKWREAVEKHELPWPQVIDTADINESVAINYGVKAFPTKCILNAGKKIMGRFVGEEEDFYKKLDEVLGNK
ncbi:hypothetical protein AAE02nite_04580 [Adhaeribacter aerolatus]|uniref:Thioredoxin domain-containing protein n=1 Tax=Adhaeribacter aerolatus TaxID=670289 RepID=A0A512ASV1_9BACT|nr:TlpA disulfide reductase family protein [Adhaeribacter aerolatus]GEO02794.1 hypothetical protein AAE02nite_04580 [Adhaeribacter aerolatus]